jgi:hypothetical protein
MRYNIFEKILSVLTITPKQNPEENATFFRVLFCSEVCCTTKVLLPVPAQPLANYVLNNAGKNIR